MKVNIKYFALLREAVGTGDETIELAQSEATVEDVRRALCRDAAHRQAFESVTRIRAAVNGEMAPMSAPVADADTVAFFPPVTGG